MQDFPPNSFKARSRLEDPVDPKKVEQVVTSAEAVRRKKGLGRQFKETFMTGSAKSALEVMIVDVVVPSARDLVAEALRSGIDNLIYGDKRPRSRRMSPPIYTNATHVDYRSVSSPQGPPSSRPRTLSREARTRLDFDEIIIQSRPEANEVIDQMFDILSRYGSVSVADLYELTGIRSTHTDHKWGWTKLPGAKVTTLHSGKGFLLDLPEPEQLG